MNTLEALSVKCCNYFKNLLVDVPYHPVSPYLKEYGDAHPDANAFELKAAQYEILAEHIELIVFDESPFYFVNNISRCPGLLQGPVSAWTYIKKRHIF